MRQNLYRSAIALMVVIFVSSCEESKIHEQTGRQTKTEKLFSKGNKIVNDNFTGDAWLNMLMESDSLYDLQMGNVTFAPGARSNWHLHPGGQILIVTDGAGLYQEKGRPIERMKKGDIIKCPPNVLHWHGATPSDTLVHIAISPNAEKGKVIWQGKVSDEEYTTSGK